ncbi:hypothetical protein G9P44_002169 [Scheffersomyces stipitis]|nr:hypothetical protein G9P44_002169 [Scheffersomyces stipitis]
MDGTIDSKHIQEDLSKQLGISRATVSSHWRDAFNWTWYDNQIALLVNLLRFFYLSELSSKGAFTKGTFPKCGDSNIHVDINAAFKFVDDEVTWHWPGQRSGRNYPVWRYISDELPSTGEIPFVNLKGLLEEEAKIVLMMMGQWISQTNCKLDFSYPVLARQVDYRYDSRIASLEEWLSGSETSIDYQIPRPGLIWSALCKYVMVNRLQNQFHKAANIVAQLFLTVCPRNFEDMTWLTHPTRITLPRFGSVRGRYSILTNGIPALLEAKALEDWKEIRNNPDILFSLGIILATAFNIGLAKRDFLFSNKSLPRTEHIDVALSVSSFNFFESAVAFATGLPYPVKGREDLYLTFPTLINPNTTYRFPISEVEMQQSEKGIVCHGVPFVGSPFVCFPLAVFEDSSPYSGKFLLPPPLRVVQNGMIYSPLSTWKLAFICKIIGYDLYVNYDGTQYSQTERYDASDDSFWVRLYQGPNSTAGEGIYVSFDALKRREHFLVEFNLRTILTKQIEFDISVLSSRIESDYCSNETESSLNIKNIICKLPGIQVITGDDVLNFTGYIDSSKSTNTSSPIDVIDWGLDQENKWIRLTLIESMEGSKVHRYIINDPKSFPTWVRFRARIQAVSRMNSTHMLVDVVPSSQVSSYSSGLCFSVALKWFGEVRNVTLWRNEDYYGVYIKTDYDTNIMGPILKRNISMIYSIVDGIVFNESDIKWFLERVFDVDPKIRPVSFCDSYTYVRSKVTAQHHTHLRPAEVLSAAEEVSEERFHFAKCIQKLLYDSGINVESTVASFMVYIISLSSYWVPLILDSAELWKNCSGEDDLLSRLKKVSSHLKAAHSVQLQPLTELFELPVLMNRGIGSVDWSAERRNRTYPNCTNVSPEEVYNSAFKIFELSRTLGYKYPKMELEDYIQNRWEWVPGGSVHSQYAEDDAYIIKGLHSRNKFVTLNLMPKGKLESFFHSRPEVRAWTSTKYEWGKQRAIYGTDLRSTVISNFAMFRCEESLKHMFPIGEQAESRKVHKRIGHMLNGYDSFCFDYDDFNSQHSIHSMKAVLVAFLDAYLSDMSPAQKEAMIWTINSVDEMYALDPNSNMWYKLNGTLLSGWRLTTFMNTVLNYAYMDIAGAFDVEGFSDSVHNGDDVMISLNTIGAAVNIMHKMKRINARAQVTKCNILSISEFLRVEHGMNGHDGLGAQYLTRSCATITHSRIESNESISVIRLIEADETRLKDLENRTSIPEVIPALRKQLQRRVESIFGISVADCEIIRNAHPVVGGCSRDPLASIDMVIDVNSGAFEIPIEVIDPSQWPGVFDYVQALDNKLDGQIEKKKIIDAVVKGSRLTIARSRSIRVKVIENRNRDKSLWERSMFRAYKEFSVSYFVHLSKFMGIPPVSNIDKGEAVFLLNSIRNSSDQLRGLQILL